MNALLYSDGSLDCPQADNRGDRTKVNAIAGALAFFLDITLMISQ